jgi:hypothetical protein
LVALSEKIAVTPGFLQHDPTALIVELSTTGTANVTAGNPPSGSIRGDAVVSSPLVKNIRQVSANA